MNLQQVVKELADLVAREREIRQAMRKPNGCDKYQEYQKQLDIIDIERARLEYKRDELQGQAVARGILK